MSLRCVLLIAALVICAMHTVNAQRGHKCSGMGQRFCNGANFDADTCPSICQKKACDRIDEDDVEIDSNGVTKYKSGYSWINVVKDGVWDNTYIHDDYICYGVCWYKPWEARCDVWGTTKDGVKFCKLLNCEHDKGSKSNEGDRYAGCHFSKEYKDDDGRKPPFHRPTCEECYHVFPACQKELSSVLSSSEKRSIDIPDGTSSAHWNWNDRKWGNTRLYRRNRRNGSSSDGDDDDVRKSEA